MALVVGDDLDASVALNTDTRVGSSQVDTNHGAILRSFVFVGLYGNRT